MRGRSPRPLALSGHRCALLGAGSDRCRGGKASLGPQRPRRPVPAAARSCPRLVLWRPAAPLAAHLSSTCQPCFAPCSGAACPAASLPALARPASSLAHLSTPALHPFGAPPCPHLPCPHLRPSKAVAWRTPPKSRLHTLLSALPCSRACGLRMRTRCWRCGRAAWATSGRRWPSTSRCA